MQFASYQVGEFFDEMFSAEGRPRAIASRLLKSIEALGDGEILNRQKAAERALFQMGITFNVYGEQAGLEKIFPFDILPRIISATEWSRIERGLKQRIRSWRGGPQRLAGPNEQRPPMRWVNVGRARRPCRAADRFATLLAGAAGGHAPPRAGIGAVARSDWPVPMNNRRR